MTTEGLIFEGWVYTIDPVTHNWVLFQPAGSDTTPTIQLVMNAAVEKVQVVEDICPQALSDHMNNYGAVVKVHELSALVTTVKVSYLYGYNI